MPLLRSLLDPKSYFQFVQRRIQDRRLRLQPNLRGATVYPPGHYHSPLLDIEGLGPTERRLRFDGPEHWEHIDLRPTEQREYYEDLLESFPALAFPQHKSPDYCYYWENDWFPLADAFTLSGIIRKEKPRRMVEVGSGFSSSVTLDTLRQTGMSAELMFIEPFPDRLQLLLSPDDRSSATILVQQVQEVPLTVFDQLDESDVLFIDSSHVAKIGSDVTFLLLRVLPRLRRGVLIHFHDIFYPFSYPVAWVREGRAWNEALFLRAFLVGNPEFQVVAFNSFAGHCWPELFHSRFPAFLTNMGGSLWLRKVR